jgi:hypothetical protein
VTGPRRPHLAVALIAAMTLAGLLWVALKAEASTESTVGSSAPRLYDEPFRGVPLKQH